MKKAFQAEWSSMSKDWEMMIQFGWNVKVYVFAFSNTTLDKPR